MEFGTVFAALYAGHYLADYYVQTNHQSAHKGGVGGASWVGRWNAAKHAVTYTLTLAAVLGLVLTYSGAETSGTGTVTLAVLAVNGFTHYIIDRRWTLEAFARKTGRGPWIDRDREALPKMDQAAHIVLLGVCALVIVAMA
jgi:hypothetical protein